MYAINKFRENYFSAGGMILLRDFHYREAAVIRARARSRHSLQLFITTGGKCRFVVEQPRGEVIPVHNKSRYAAANDGDANAHGGVQLIILFRANPVSPMVLICHAFAPRIALTRTAPRQGEREPIDRVAVHRTQNRGGIEPEDTSYEFSYSLDSLFQTFLSEVGFMSAAGSDW